MTRRTIIWGLTLLLFLAAFGSPATAVTLDKRLKDAMWAVEKTIIAAEQAGDAAAAAAARERVIPVYEEVLAAIRSGQSSLAEKDILTNLAITWGKLGDYRASIRQFDQAVEAYDKASYYWTPAGDANAAVVYRSRADRLRSTVRVFFEQDGGAAANRHYLKAKYEPLIGAYLGAYVEIDPAIRDNFPLFNETTGRKHAAFLTYVDWNVPFPKEFAEKVRKAGGIAQIAWNPMGGLQEVRDDAYVRGFARAAREAGIPIFLRFAGEMNGDWVPWNGDPHLYIEKFRLIHDIMEQEAPNVAMVWTPNDNPVLDIDKYYPGDAYVDWVGVNFYNTYIKNADPKMSGADEDLFDKLRHVYETYSDRKPIQISEFAIVHYDHVLKKDVSEWARKKMRRFYTGLPRMFPRVKALYWFDVDEWQTPNPYSSYRKYNDYRLTHDGGVLDTYRELISDGYYLSDYGTEPVKASVYYQDVTSAGLPAGQARLSAVARIYDPEISQVEYWVNGARVARVSTVPYEFSYDFAPLAGETVQLRVVVYDSAGAAAADKRWTLKVAPAWVSLDGRPIGFDVFPVMIGGRTMVPMRQIFEALGVQPVFDPATGAITATGGSKIIRLTVGQTEAEVAGKRTILEVPPQIVDGRTMVPLRFISESLGLLVTWNQEKREVVISSRP